MQFLVGISLGIATCGSGPTLPHNPQTFINVGFLSSKALLQEKTTFLDFFFFLAELSATFSLGSFKPECVGSGIDHSWGSNIKTKALSNRNSANHN